jgi:hypothetical protein
MPSIELAASGHNEFVTKLGNYTVVPADSGLVLNVTATATITLPATVVGQTVLVRVGKEGITVTIQPAAADNIYGGGLTAVDNKALIFTNQPAGSYVMLVADGTAAGGYAILKILGTATKAP